MKSASTDNHTISALSSDEPQTLVTYRLVVQHGCLFNFTDSLLIIGLNFNFFPISSDRKHLRFAQFFGGRNLSNELTKDNTHSAVDLEVLILVLHSER